MKKTIYLLVSLAFLIQGCATKPFTNVENQKEINIQKSKNKETASQVAEDFRQIGLRNKAMSEPIFYSKIQLTSLSNPPENKDAEYNNYFIGGIAIELKDEKLFFNDQVIRTVAKASNYLRDQHPGKKIDILSYKLDELEPIDIKRYQRAFKFHSNMDIYPYSRAKIIPGMHYYKTLDKAKGVLSKNQFIITYIDTDANTPITIR
ncbi:MAG: hypothetical protein IBX55_00275 [Methyloprofundus sp.]|nr:hypothetical protein [Methyloprofundus sp.]